jgi:hypothetical protein
LWFEKSALLPYHVEVGQWAVNSGSGSGRGGEGLAIRGEEGVIEKNFSLLANVTRVLAGPGRELK